VGGPQSGQLGPSQADLLLQVAGVKVDSPDDAAQRRHDLVFGAESIHCASVPSQANSIEHKV
jgi:hypothetical protein